MRDLEMKIGLHVKSCIYKFKCDTAKDNTTVD